MKLLLAIIGCVVLAGCAGAPPVQLTARMPAFPVATAQCPVWVSSGGILICRNAPQVIQAADALDVPALLPEPPEEVVGEERPHLVLDGAS